MLLLPQSGVGVLILLINAGLLFGFVALAASTVWPRVADKLRPFAERWFGNTCPACLRCLGPPPPPEEGVGAADGESPPAKLQI